ncbi:aspartate/glutamate racemase family protein [Bordetella trematum]|uniref:aspartate/glutamate racemase family protein n=1 Tax=Bordetella trematum TaxID=123899 RepID=UPI000DE5BA10|nr:amino acid racemase [Bordetella trematum]
MNSTASCYLGVLGGMGPLAGAAFALRLAALTPASIDQQHIPTLLLNDPRIPDRTTARLYGGADPLPAMLRGVRMLNEAGARLIAVPCNTAHLWYEQLAAASECEVLHIIESVAQDLRRQGIARGRIGLMGTAATLSLGLYQQTLEKHGYTCIVPTEEEIDTLCMASIRAVKGNAVDEAFEPAAECVRRLGMRGADAVVLGCTELPLAVPHALRKSLGIALTDSIDALALAAISHYQAHTADADEALAADETVAA